MKLKGILCPPVDGELGFHVCTDKPLFESLDARCIYCGKQVWYTPSSKRAETSCICVGCMKTMVEELANAGLIKRRPEGGH